MSRESNGKMELDFLLDHSAPTRAPATHHSRGPHPNASMHPSTAPSPSRRRSASSSHAPTAQHGRAWSHLDMPATSLRGSSSSASPIHAPVMSPFNRANPHPILTSLDTRGMEAAVTLSTFPAVSRGPVAPSSADSRPRQRTNRVRKDKGTRPRNHKCWCGQSFNKREHLKRHDLLVHDKFRPYKCEDCKKEFGTKQNMQVHLTTKKHRQMADYATTS